MLLAFLFFKNLDGQSTLLSTMIRCRSLKAFCSA
jgi:hypothetical protein